MNEILARFADRLGSQRGHRIDLQVADWRKRSDDTVDMLLRYNARSGDPTRSQVAAFVVNEFQGKLLANPATIVNHGVRDHQQNGAIRLLANMNREKQPVNRLDMDPGSYRKMDPDGKKFMHVLTAEVWNIERDENDVPVMVRQIDEDVEEIVRARLNAKGGNACVIASVRFEKLGITAGAHVFDPGDEVEYACRGTMNTGLVKAVDVQAGETVLTIENATMKTTDRVASTMISRIITKNTIAEDAGDRKLADYFERAYGDRKMAEKMVKR